MRSLRRLVATAAALTSFAAPLAAGLWLEIGWLTQTGFIVLFVFILGLWGHEWQRMQRHREVRENMRRILAEREREVQE